MGIFLALVPPADYDGLQHNCIMSLQDVFTRFNLTAQEILDIVPTSRHEQIISHKAITATAQSYKYTVRKLHLDQET